MNSMQPTKSRLHTYSFSPLVKLFLNGNLKQARFPKLRLSIVPNKYLRVNTELREYFGAIAMHGVFKPGPEVTDWWTEEKKRLYWVALLEANDRPEFLLLKEGKRTGICGICGRALTDPASIKAGIGPICAGKIGLGG